MVDLFVLDTSAALSLVFPDEATDGSMAFWSAAGASKILVPQLWLVEIANAMLTAVKRKRLTDVQAKASWNQLSRLTITIESFPCSLVEAQIVHSLATNRSLTSYDAVYLALARRARCPLVTLDSQLITAGRLEHVSVLNPTQEPP